MRRYYDRITIVVAGDLGEVEWALPEAGLMW
jgi:hypothetical protein